MQCLGPCGREVMQTNGDGLCARCQQERAKAAPAAVVRTEAHEPRLCKRGCGKGPHRGNCRITAPNGAVSGVAPKRVYRRRGATPDARRTRNSVFEKSNSLIEVLRGEYQEELAAAEKLCEKCRARLEAVNDILDRVQKGK